MRFGEMQSLQSYYSQFTNKRQKYRESITSLGSDIEKLSQSAYPECPDTVRDKITCAQFVSALSDGFIKRSLQIERITFSQNGDWTSKSVKLIQKNSFQHKKEGNFSYEKKKGKNFNFKKGEKEQDEHDDKHKEKKLIKMDLRNLKREEIIK